MIKKEITPYKKANKILYRISINNKDLLNLKLKKETDKINLENYKNHETDLNINILHNNELNQLKNNENIINELNNTLNENNENIKQLESVNKNNLEIVDSLKEIIKEHDNKVSELNNAIANYKTIINLQNKALTDISKLSFIDTIRNKHRKTAIENIKELDNKGISNYLIE